MTRAETLIPFLVAIIALLGYMAWVLRKITKAARWIAKVPKEHEWLMATVTTHSKQLDELLKLINRVVTAQGLETGRYESEPIRERH